MDLLGIGPIADLVKEILAFFPNADQRAQMQEKLQDLAKAIVDGQNATNAAEAATGNLFLAGWRPFIGWICGFGFLYSVIQPVLHLPATDTAVLNNILYGLLGLGTMRSAEKIGGVATTAIKKIIK